MQRQSNTRFIPAIIFLRAMSATLGSDLAYAAPEASDVAFVQEASGRVVAFSQGKPILLEALDTIKDRTQVDLRANSELRICHYQLRQVLVLKGPVRASISRDSVTAENAKPILTYSGSCSAPIVSTYSGGVLARGVKTIPVNDIPGKH